MKPEEGARSLEIALTPLAQSLGLRIKVTYSAYNYGYRINARMLSISEDCMLDEDVLVRQPHGSEALIKLLQRELEDVQLKLHDTTAAAMQKHDVRERQYGLSKEDKRLLHDMFMDASYERLRDFSRAEAGCKKVDEYQALMNRLYR